MATLDEALLVAYGALGEQRWADALRALEAVAPDAARPGAVARLHAFRAQAQTALGEFDSAATSIALALRSAKSEPQSDLGPLRALQTLIQAQRAAAALALAGAQNDAQLRTRDPASLSPDEALRLANLRIDAGEPTEPLLLHLFETAADPRQQVLTALALARLGDHAWIHRAHALADAADDPNLLTAVARAARSVGVRLLPLLGSPSLPR